MSTAYRDLVFYRAYADLKAESQRTYLGILWWIIEPVTSMAIYYFVFSVVLKRGTEDFVPFLLIGIVMWQWFAGAINKGARSIIDNRGLVSQIPIPKLVYPTVTFLSNAAKFAISFVLLTVFLWVYGFSPTIHYALLPLILLAEVIIIFGLMLPLSALTPFLPDISNALAHILRLMFYLSGVLYPPERIPESYRWLMDFNPMAVAIQSYRDVLMYGRWPIMGANLVGLTILAAVSALAGVWLIRRLDGVYAKRMDR